jgi:hypothetical protein
VRWEKVFPAAWRDTVNKENNFTFHVSSLFSTSSRRERNVAGVKAES